MAWPDPARHAAFEAWLAPLAAAQGLRTDSLRPASADASFRRYLRLDDAAGGSRIVMDAPPPQEDVRPFVAVAEALAAAGLPAPRVLAADAARGFLLLDDLGSELALAVLQQAVARGDAAAADRLLREAVGLLLQWQQRIDASALPAYDEALLRRELALFPDWCVQREHGVAWTEAQQALWQGVCDRLVASALAQPVLAVHRDYMPRNLMCTPAGLAMLDFQDAVRGPITYDLASLIRDAFLSWDEAVELDVAVRYWEQARAAGLPVDADFGEFWRQVEWMGLQRHLKVLGIFCRLKHRDGKPRYAEDLPRFFGYAHRVASRYTGLRPLTLLLEPLMGTSRVNAFY
ncbi:putative phosphotransferase related to Ser/Thr protein kinase [Piscinibacter sakaiensis]|uniref:Putative phosphotransferase related to Ser/Thr protein kinase n=1 Tax=Piscinibacter sakaiensis TaxID=1547922 RepID=A0A0K8P6Q6_PISS1|nr:putative phosphotransferase related to Ser/Thr protein kinase [Piscinibacter sakaiensis]